MKVLAAVSNDLESTLEGHGFEVLSVADADAVEDALGEEPTLAIVDESLDHVVDVVVRLKARLDGPDRDRIPIVALTPDGGRRLRCLPDVEAPLSSADPKALLEQAKQLVLLRARQRRLFDSEAHFRVPTTPDDVDRVGDLIEVLVSGLGYTEEEEVKLGTTLREAIGNAFEHGNSKDPARTIDIHFFRASDRLAFVITDEGKGFDTSSFLGRADQVSALEHTRSRRETEARPGGLGVFIMKETCDDIRFNEAGNAIYLMKHLPKAP